MKTTVPKKIKTSKPEKDPAIVQDFPGRLAELEVELRLYPSRPAAERMLQSVEDPAPLVIAGEKVIHFLVAKNVYAVGHTDATYPGSNHARGVRHIRLYKDGKAVLDIEGDYEDQQFGSNFRFQTIDLYLPGDWEQDFLKLTDDLRHHREKRRNVLKKKRLAEHGRLKRSGAI